VHAKGGPLAPEIVYKLGLPLLGICYGLHTMALQLGGRVVPSELKEFGYARVDVVAPSRLLQGIEDHLDAAGQAQLDVWMSHGDTVAELPAGFALIASTPSAPVSAIADESRGFYGLQFHPEVTHTAQGHRICNASCVRFACAGLWTAENIIDDAIQRTGPGRPARIWACPAGWTRAWSQPCCTAPSATS
jgi:GMP synthase (glutamine-hydrolysing)